MERFTAKSLHTLLSYANSIGAVPDGFKWHDYQAYGGHEVVLKNIKGTWVKDFYFRRGTPRHAATEWLLWMSDNMVGSFHDVYDEAYDMGIRL